ncbi:hypothetical protein [Fibrella arboris]|uniref:hypothetical protein n=1 Tax=Fibrella arboris TaxID=3242486 RepID=UPI0035223CDD
MLQLILNWSEVWAPLIPLMAYQQRRNQPVVFKSILVYLCGALALNLASDIIGDFKRYLPGWLQTNLLLYNIHSLFRFVCFVYFFNAIAPVTFVRFRRVLPAIYLLSVLVNYFFSENYFDQTHISGNLFTIEAYFLLIYCLLYYLAELRNDVDSIQDSQEFWVVTGLSIYVVISFFIFLFYVPMIQENPMLAENMWGVHNLAYITLCLFITKAIYVPVQSDH